MLGNRSSGLASSSSSATMATRPSSVDYFFGRISREEAERFLTENGCSQGLFLLRESMATIGNFALSICHQKRVHHYSIERRPDGQVMIQDGRRFIGPVELVNHHRKQLDGFLTKPLKECKRPNGYPIAWPGVTYLELEQQLLNLANSRRLRGSQLENVLGPQRQHFVALIAKELHKDQPWFHGRVSRDEADKTLAQSGHQDGKYLVRVRDDNTSFALSLSYRNETKHYKIDKNVQNTEEKLAIEDGPQFDCLMDMIAHYHNKTDGLLCKLTVPCRSRNYEARRLAKPQEKNPAYGLLPPTPGGAMGVGAVGGSPLGGKENALGLGESRRPLPMTPDAARPLPLTPDEEQGLAGASGGARQKQPPAIPIKDSWDEPDIPEATNGSSENGDSVDDELQKIYDVVPRTEDVFNLNKRDLELFDKLGAGNFGAVMKGVYRREDHQIPVAVKTLKHDDLPNAESEIMKEARLMANLEHRNIVRLIGVCRSEMIMLVMELAALGPLNKYLRHRTDLPPKMVLELMFQVAEGMQYLESKNFVHRDLAARNVLLVNDSFAKISDFGMSKALGLGNEYYKAESAGKWPLKWYAPECIYFFRFDSKSDVWSYGVTLWEATSYGQKPYKGLRGQQILEKIEQGARLEKPDLCPPGVYEIMLKCWSYEKSERPSFKEIVELLRKHCR